MKEEISAQQRKEMDESVQRLGESEKYIPCLPTPSLLFQLLCMPTLVRNDVQQAFGESEV